MSSTSSNVLFEIKGSLSMCILWHSRSNPVISLTIRGCAIKDWALMWRRVRNETVNGWWVDGLVVVGCHEDIDLFCSSRILFYYYARTVNSVGKECSSPSRSRGLSTYSGVCRDLIDCQQEHNRPFVTALKHLLPQRAFLGLTFGAAMRAPDPMSGALTLICQCVWRPSRLCTVVRLSVHLDRHPAPSCYAGDAQGQL